MQRAYSVVERKLVEVPPGEGRLTVYVNPDREERQYLLESLKIDEHTLSSALDPDELSRVEFEPEHVAIIYKRPKNYSTAEKLVFGVSSTGVFLFKERLVVVVGDDINLLDGTTLLRAQSITGLLLRFMSRSVFHFRKHLRAISAISDELQAEINQSMENKHLISMFGLQKSLVYYVNAIHSNGALLDRLRAAASKLALSTDELELLDDLIIENSQCARQGDIYSSILASLMDARASIVANNINILVKRLNVITIAIMVPTLVVSAFSMNVGIPWQGYRYAFWLIIGLAVLSVVGFLPLWRRRGG